MKSILDSKLPRVGALMATMLVVTTAGAAVAEGYDGTARNAALDASADVELSLLGRIDPRCLLSGGGEIDMGRLQGGEGAQATFALDCNVPFDIVLQSTRGGLAHDTMPGGQGPYSGTLAYDLHISIPTLLPTPSFVDGRYSSQELRGSKTLSSGNGIGAGRGTLTIDMHRPDGAGLLAGSYSEVLWLTVTPKM